jgi:CheY-like chemotaxis protein
MRILVADDEVVSRRLIEATVRRWGYDVVVAKDGLEASQILQSQNAPHLAILDWMMPGLDGLQLCRQASPGRQGAVHLYPAAHCKARQKRYSQGFGSGRRRLHRQTV